MKFTELKATCAQLKNKKWHECKLLEIKEKQTDFNFQGVYILTKDDEVVYIGSAYARNVSERLKQYPRRKQSGNQTLYNDLIDSGKCDKDEAESYIKSLEVHAFEDESTEYKLIDKCGLFIANKAGNKNKK